MNPEELDSDDYTTKFSDYFEFKAVIGKGAFGTVISAVSKSDSHEYAIKVIQKQNVSPKDWEKLRLEAQILSDLNHPNIVRFKEIIETEKRIFLVMELVQGGQLKDFIEARFSSGEKFSDDEVHTIIKSIFSAVRYLHSKEIVHRDLKPENILLHDRSDLSTIKIADFGLSTQFSQDGFVRSLRQRCGTMIYMAPELALDEQYGKPVDIWSCGLIMFILLSGGKHPLYEPKDTPESFLKKLKKPKWTFGENFTPIAQNFFLKVMNRNPLARYTAEDLQKHPWFTRRFNDEVPLSAHEVVTSFSFEQSFTRILKAIYLVNHVKYNEEGLALEDEYRNLVAKTSEKHQDDEKLKNRMPRNSVMLEYNSLQNLLGISPTNHKGSSAGGSPNKDHKNAINIFPVSKYKLQTEETKSKEQETRKEVDEEDGEEAPQLKRRDSFKTLKLPDIQIQNNDIPSRNSSPFAVSISYSKHSKSNSNIPKNLHNQTLPLEQSESPGLSIPTDPEEEENDALAGLNHFVSPVSAKVKKKKLFLFKSPPEEQGFESDHQPSGVNKISEGLLKNRSPSLNYIKGFKHDNSNNSSYVSDESNESTNDNPRTLTSKELQKTPKKSPFFHSAQKSPTPITTSGLAKNKASSFTHKSNGTLRLKPGTKELLTLPPITPARKDIPIKKKDERIFSFKTTGPEKIKPLATPSTSANRNRPLIEAPEALFFGSKTLNTPKKEFKSGQEFRAIVGYNVKESQNNSRKKLLSVLKNDN